MQAGRPGQGKAMQVGHEQLREQVARSAMYFGGTMARTVREVPGLRSRGAYLYDWQKTESWVRGVPGWGGWQG